MSLQLASSPEELRAAFFALQTREDIASLLDIQDKQLIYHLYILPESARYKTFQISKKSGGYREISAPVSALKIIQRKLNQVLCSVYVLKPSVHGFANERNIRTNAKGHARRSLVFNIDLKDFFPTINFGRVRGMFMGNPYFRSAEVATVLAQICCFNNQLPQGAPTSPIVSNMICAKMDAQMQQLAKRHRCTYSRYADDITFSTTRSTFPDALVHKSDSGQIEPGDELRGVITGNHFEVNPEKVRLQTKNRRQEVTGLTVNKFPNVRRGYVRQLRGMLHAWRKYGPESTEERFHQKYDVKQRAPGHPLPSLNSVVQGRIAFLGMVRGKQNPIYIRLRDQLFELAPDLRSHDDGPSAQGALPPVLIFTEGKTDWMHLKAASERLRSIGKLRCPDLEFHEVTDDGGNDQLFNRCRNLASVKQLKLSIFIFDRDDERYKRRVTDEAGDSVDPKFISAGRR